MNAISFDRTTSNDGTRRGVKDPMPAIPAGESFGCLGLIRPAPGSARLPGHGVVAEVLAVGRRIA